MLQIDPEEFRQAFKQTLDRNWKGYVQRIIDRDTAISKVTGSTAALLDFEVSVALSMIRDAMFFAYGPHGNTENPRTEAAAIYDQLATVTTEVMEGLIKECRPCSSTA